jgi:hypothetical protein
MIISFQLPVSMSTRLMHMLLYTVSIIATLSTLSHVCMVLTLVLCTYGIVVPKLEILGIHVTRSSHLLGACLAVNGKFNSENYSVV